MFKEGQNNIWDEDGPGRPTIASIPEIMASLNILIFAERKVIKQVIFEQVSISVGYYRVFWWWGPNRPLQSHFHGGSSEIKANIIQLNFHHHHHHHHHHVEPLAWISLTLSRHPSLSFIAFGWSSGLHPISSHSCCMYVRTGHPAFAWLYAGVHRSTSLMNSSLLLQQCPVCLVRLTCIVFVMGGKCPYSWCLVGCCSQD